MKITWLGHCCFRIDTGKSSILIDPFLTGNPTFEDTGLTLHGVTKGITHVALTHGLTTTQAMRCKSARRRARRYSPYSSSRCTWRPSGRRRSIPVTLAARSFTTISTSPSFLRGTLLHDGRWKRSLSRRLLRPRHQDARGQDHLSYGRHGNLLGHGLDQRTLSAGHRLCADRRSLHDGAKTAALACKRYFQFETVVPCHYSTFPMLDQTADKFVAEMGGNIVRVPEVGVPFEL
jgi:hypothetical protein